MNKPLTRRELLTATFGSDNPVYGRIYNQKEWIDVLVNDAPKHGFKFTDEELHLFFTRNFNDYLNGVTG